MCNWRDTRLVEQPRSDCWDVNVHSYECNMIQCYAMKRSTGGVHPRTIASCLWLLSFVKTAVASTSLSLLFKCDSHIISGDILSCFLLVSIKISAFINFSYRCFHINSFDFAFKYISLSYATIRYLHFSYLSSGMSGIAVNFKILSMTFLDCCVLSEWSRNGQSVSFTAAVSFVEPKEQWWIKQIISRTKEFRVVLLMWGFWLCMRIVNGGR